LISAARNRHVLDDHEYAYLQHHTRGNAKDLYSYLYLMFKVHKKRRSNGETPTRPVCSDVASVTNPIGKWVDLMLQPIAQSMETYFKDSFSFKDIIENLVLPPGSRLFTADDVSMYTNINTDAAMAVISTFVIEKQYDSPHYHAETLIRALEIVMRDNIVKFNDKYARQISGTAMGKPPAPCWANIFEGLHEKDFLPRWRSFLPSYKWFIDDVHAVWLPPAGMSHEKQRSQLDRLQGGS